MLELRLVIGRRRWLEGEVAALVLSRSGPCGGSAIQADRWVSNRTISSANKGPIGAAPQAFSLEAAAPPSIG